MYQSTHMAPNRSHSPRSQSIPPQPLMTKCLSGFSFQYLFSHQKRRHTFLNFLKFGNPRQSDCTGRRCKQFLLSGTSISKMTIKFPLIPVSLPKSSTMFHSSSWQSNSGLDILKLLKSRSKSSSFFFPFLVEATALRKAVSTSSLLTLVSMVDGGLLAVSGATASTACACLIFFVTAFSLWLAGKKASKL